MSDSLFYILLVAAIAFYLLSAQRRRRALMRAYPELASGAKAGPVPGYSFMPGEGIRWDPHEPAPPGLGQTWEPISVETAHAGRRTRIVLSLRDFGLPDTEKFTLMKTLAGRIQKRPVSHVTAVQLFKGEKSQEPEALVIYAGDGRGWTGTTHDAPLTAVLPDRAPFRL